MIIDIQVTSMISRRDIHIILDALELASSFGLLSRVRFDFDSNNTTQLSSLCYNDFSKMKDRIDRSDD